MRLKKEYWKIYRAAYQHAELTDDQIQDIVALYRRDGKEAIFKAAKVKKLIPAVSALFCKIGLDLDYWNPIVNSYRERNSRVIKCLDEMYRLLAANGIENIVVVENFGALLSSAQDVAMFGSGDVDEYALPEEREKIYLVLKKNGYRIGEVKSGNLIVSSNIRKDTFPDGFYFGINWDVTNRVNLPSFTANGDFIGWDRCRYYKKTAIRLPSPEGQMYVCLMHIAVHGFCKAPDIRLYYDIANAAECKVDWNLILKWAERDGNSVKIAIAAYLAYKLLNVDIPDIVFSVKNKKQFQRLLRVVYDSKWEKLYDFPSKWKCLLIDIYSDDCGALAGLKNILFPNKDWVKGRYGSIICGRIKHFFSLIK